MTSWRGRHDRLTHQSTAGFDRFRRSREAGPRCSRGLLRRLSLATVTCTRSRKTDLTNDQLCELLFAALAAGDDDTVRRLCAADLRAQQNGGPEMTIDAVLGYNAAVHAVVKDFEYADAARSSTPTGFVEEHTVRGTLPDGSQLDVAVCVVGDVRDGKVTSVREYLDSAAAAGLIEALT